MRLTAPSLLLVATLACAGPPTEPPPPPTALTFAGPLVPGETVMLRGRNLNTETAVLVDGVRVSLASVTDSTAEFLMPVLRPCDTDGREIQLALAASNSLLRARLRLPAAAALAPGESRLFVGTVDCLQLPASNAEFVLSALNATDVPDETPQPLADVTAWTESDPAPLDVPGPSATQTTAGPGWRATPLGTTTPSALPWPAPYTENPKLFDSRYATANPGDTVRFVDWQRASSCSQAPDAVPTYPVVVAAVSGLTVVAVDLRLAGANDYLSAEGRAYLQRAAQIADPLIVPAMRRVFDRAYQPLPAAGGRHFHIVTAIAGVADATDGNTSKPQSVCPLASEMVTTLLAAPVLANPLGPRITATQLVHEYAHNADEITGRRYGQPGGSLGWMQEAFAVNAEETAARLAAGESSRAHLSRLTDAMPFRAGTTNSDWGLYPSRSPWTGTGVYKQGAALLSFARERRGEAPLDGPAPGLYLGLLARRSWTLSALADALGSTPLSLLDAWAIADACDDLGTADLPGLRLESWDDSERIAGNEGPGGGFPPESRPARAVPRVGKHTELRLAAAPGSYAAAYFFANGSRGVTLRVAPTATATARVRLTRTR